MVYLNMTCVAPRRLISPLNMTLLSVFIFLRHGERTPVDRWMPKNDSREIWNCDSNDAIAPQMQSFARSNPSNPNSYTHRRYHSTLDPKLIPFPKNCAKGQLTLDGMRQLKELGAFYHKELVLKRHFLPEYYDPNLVDFRATYSDRAIRSLTSFLVGLYPNADDPDEIITFLTGTLSGREPLNPDPYGCKDLQDAYEDFISTDEFKERRDRAWEVHDELYKAIGLEKDHQNWQWIGDWLYSYYCNTNADLTALIPKEVSDYSFEVAMNDTAYYSNGFFDKYRDIPAGPIFRLLYEAIDKRLSGESQTKFSVFSAHDTTIAAILAYFGHANMRGIAPYRSHLAVEMYQSDHGPMLRFSLNGEVITIDGQDMISLANLRYMTVNSVKKCIYDNEIH